MGHELIFVDGISTIIYNRKNTGAVKKSSYIILFMLLVSAAGLSCRSSSTSPHKNRDRIIDAYRLPGPAFVQWMKLKEKWFKEVYRPFQEVPLHLRGYSVRVTLGTGLKC